MVNLKNMLIGVCSIAVIVNATPVNISFFGIVTQSNYSEIKVGDAISYTFGIDFDQQAYTYDFGTNSKEIMPDEGYGANIPNVYRSNLFFSDLDLFNIIGDIGDTNNVEYYGYVSPDAVSLGESCSGSLGSHSVGLYRIDCILNGGYYSNSFLPFHPGIDEKYYVSEGYTDAYGNQYLISSVVTTPEPNIGSMIFIGVFSILGLFVSRKRK